MTGIAPGAHATELAAQTVAPAPWSSRPASGLRDTLVKAVVRATERARELLESES